MSVGWRRERLYAKVSRALTAIVLLGLFTTGCASASMGSARQTAAIATSTPTAPLTNEGRLALRVRQAEGAAAKSITLAYHQATSTVDVTVTLGWTPIWKTEFAKAQTAAKLACYEAQAALWTSGIALNKVTVTVLGQALDDYGQIITGAYAVATMTSAHASATQWTSTSPDTAWSLYDEVFLRPLYGSDWMYPHPTTPPAS